MKRFPVHLAGALLSFALLSPLYAQVPSISTEQVRGNVYLVKGAGAARTGFLVGEKEVVVIDGNMTEAGTNQTIAEIRKIAALPIRHILITHSDRDHVNGLVGFPPGALIISHQHARADMTKEKLFQSTGGEAFLPAVTYTDRLTLYVDYGAAKKPIELLYLGPAHTNGDTVVYLPEEKVVFMGDLFFNDRDQLIHLHKGGTSFGLVKVLKALLSLDGEIFLHGHGDPVTKKEIQGHLRSIEEKQARVQALVREGKTLDQVKKFYHVDDPAAQPGATVYPSLVEVIYREVTEKQQHRGLSPSVMRSLIR